MTDATVLIPTFRHASLLALAVESALAQTGVALELFVVGDGVEDATRLVLERYRDDPRVRFFDRPKGPRHGEVHRHEALQDANGRIVCYLSDDDLLLPDHVAAMSRCLENADFAHPPSARFNSSATLEFFPWNYERPEFVEMGLTRNGSIGLTGTAHTLEAYRRLPHGWRTTPPGLTTDQYMWVQFLERPGLRRAMSDKLTYLAFPEPAWGGLPENERAAQLRTWLERTRDPGFRQELDAMLNDAIVRAAEGYHIWARTEELDAWSMRRTRTWRAREWLLRIGPLRGVIARRR